LREGRDDPIPLSAELYNDPEPSVGTDAATEKALAPGHLWVWFAEVRLGDSQGDRIEMVSHFFMAEQDVRPLDLVHNDQSAFWRGCLK
jgi:hypothetical protein